MQRQALDDLAEIELFAPFLQISKTDIASTRQGLKVPFAHSGAIAFIDYQAKSSISSSAVSCTERINRRNEIGQLVAAILPREFILP